MITRTRLTAIAAGIVTIGVILSTPMMVENLDSSEVMVVQSPMSGDLTAFTEPGWHWQGFGSVTKYPRRAEFTFQDVKCLKPEHKNEATRGLEIRFYDGGNATLCGSISWTMPADPKSIIAIHRDFRSAEAFETQAIRRSMEAAATFSGPTMGSFDSAAGRRNELLQILNDQTLNGVYKTKSIKTMAKDVAGIEKETTVIEIVKDDKTGQPIRAQDSYVSKYHVIMLPMTISGFKYEDRVEQQIQQQQQATNSAIISAATAKKADQEAVTAEANGRRDATKAEWEQRTLAAKTIAEAQAKVTIAEANVKEAELFKKAETLRGEGEAARKKAVMDADGQLDKRLDAAIKINQMYAEAISKAQPGAWSPAVNMGGEGKSGASNASTLVDLLTAKTAREVGVDLTVRSGKK